MPPPPQAQVPHQIYAQPQYPYPQAPLPPPMPPMYPPPHHQNYPAPAYQLNYMVPGYLTVPEQRQEDTSFWGLLGRESMRSVGKALGHTISNFFDVQPFRRPKQ
jgi:hypothetical protein